MPPMTTYPIKQALHNVLKGDQQRAFFRKSSAEATQPRGQHMANSAILARRHPRRSLRVERHCGNVSSQRLHALRQQ